MWAAASIFYYCCSFLSQNPLRVWRWMFENSERRKWEWLKPRNPWNFAKRSPVMFGSEPSLVCILRVILTASFRFYPLALFYIREFIAFTNVAECGDWGGKEVVHLREPPYNRSSRASSYTKCYLSPPKYFAAFWINGAI